MQCLMKETWQEFNLMSSVTHEIKIKILIYAEEKDKITTVLLRCYYLNWQNVKNCDISHIAMNDWENFRRIT